MICVFRFFSPVFNIWHFYSHLCKKSFAILTKQNQPTSFYIDFSLITLVYNFFSTSKKFNKTWHNDKAISMSNMDCVKDYECIRNWSLTVTLFSLIIFKKNDFSLESIRCGKRSPMAPSKKKIWKIHEDGSKQGQKSVGIWQFAVVYGTP